jgi:hypothetical protein
MFYEGKKENPVKVEGTLAVYAFDENGRDSNSARPDRKYVITQEQLAAHYSKSKIGHSYSVWIPWDEVGGMQKEITLIVRFEPKTGSAVVGDQHRLLLPGRIPQPRGADGGALPSAASLRIAAAAAMADAADAGGVRRTSYEAPVSPDDAMQQNDGGRPRRMTTTTFAVPPDMAMRAGATGAPAGNWQPPAGRLYPPASPWSNQQGPNGTPGSQAQPPSFSPASRSTPPPVGSALGRPRPLGEPLARLSRDRAQWPQLPEGSRSAPGSQPGSECANGAPADRPAAPPATN